MASSPRDQPPSPPQNYVAGHYQTRAQAYVASPVHREGEDLSQLEALLAAHPRARVLDLGCGGGHVSYRAAPLVAEVVALDVAPSMLQAVQENALARGLTNISVEKAAAENLPFPHASFDVVASRFSAHHWHDVEAALREVCRVLKPSGELILIDVVSPTDPLLDTHLQTVELLRDPAHVRDYNVPEWVGMLARARFQLDSITLRKLRMEFQSWTARTETLPAHEAAIRSLQTIAPAVVQTAFAIGADGGFDLQTATFHASRL